MILDQRYEIGRLLGEGGMGAVYIATDRLNGTRIALKRVNIPIDDLAFNSRSDYKETALALAQEFRMLSALRHPNIISVLDYGFAQEPGHTPQPYFTMQLLEGARQLTDFTDAPLPQKLDLLLQTALALTYLHRLNIMHRDLKPGNILVVDGVVKVLDFGLAIEKHSTTVPVIVPVGTLAYMSPEALRGEPTTIASDLYAFGVMMYEMLAGEFPYPMGSMHRLLTAIITDTPDMDELAIPDGLKAVLLRLLDKQPAKRYPTASAVIHAICQAADIPLPTETIAIRESFLQSAKFIGRDAELAQLMAAYEQARDETGSAWLISGESGVGKSRLIQEVRAQTLVKGAVVLEGQAISEGGSPFVMWQPIVRQLVLRSGVSDTEAGVLRPLIPDIDALLERPIPPIAPLEGKHELDRLFNTIVILFERQTRPIVLVLEDIHWAPTDLLQRVIGVVPRNNLLLIATYRNDEAPTLHDQLSGTNLITLSRLSPDETAALTVSMLGEIALDQPQLLDRIQTETEGNVFFLVEVMRVLAEEAGSLERIGRASLPERIFAGGIQRIMQRRIESIPADSQPFLYMSAIIGRELDLPVLATIITQRPDLAPTSSLEEWIAIGVGASVFSAEGDRIRFAHDKLREHLLTDFAEAATYHRSAALAIEATYPDRSANAERLLYHWQQAGDDDRTLDYATRLGNLRHERGDYVGAAEPYEIAYSIYQRQNRVAPPEIINGLAKGWHYQARFDDAAQLLTDQIARSVDKQALFAMIRERTYIYSELGKFEDAYADLERLGTLTEELGSPPELRLKTITAAVQIDFCNHRLQDAMNNIDAAVELAQQMNNGATVLAMGYERAQVLFQMGDVEGAKAEMLTLLAVYEDSENIGMINNIYAELGIYTGRAGNYAESLGYYKKALSLARQLGMVNSTVNLLANSGVSTKNTGDYRQAIAYYDEAEMLAARHKMDYVLPYIHNNRAIAQRLMGDYPAALDSIKSTYTLARQSELDHLYGHIFTTMADIALGVADYPRAAEFLAMTYTKHTEERQSLIEANKLLPQLLDHVPEAEFEAFKARMAPLSIDERGALLLAYQLPH